LWKVARNIISGAAPGSAPGSGARLQRHDTTQGHLPMRIASHILAFLAAAAISGLTLGATLA
jgi:hypothetical protein